MGALKIELRHIIRSMGIQEKCRAEGLDLYRGNLGKEEVLAAITGMGKDNAARAAGTVLKQIRREEINDLRILITGFCGALSPALKAGDLVTYASITDLSARGSGSHASGQKALRVPAAGFSENIKKVSCGCTDHVVSTPQEKKSIFDYYGAEVVDMESYWLVEVLLKNGLSPDRIFCIRAVSDGAGDMLTPYMDSTGTKKIMAGICRSAFKSVFSPLERRSNFNALKNIRKAEKSLARIPEILLNLKGL